MKLTPAKDLTILSAKSPESILQILEENTTQAAKGDGESMFIGAVEHHSFQIRRRIHQQNSFLPVIKGQVENSKGGSHIHLKMRLHSSVLLFVVVWILFTAGFAFIGYTMGNGMLIFQAQPLIMMFFGYAITLFGFRREADKAEQELLKLFKGKLINTNV